MLKLPVVYRHDPAFATEVAALAMLVDDRLIAKSLVVAFHFSKALDAVQASNLSGRLELPCDIPARKGAGDRGGG